MDCPECGTPMVKCGYSTGGSQRWKCQPCSYTTTFPEKVQVDPGLKVYATDRQAQMIDAVNEAGGFRAAARDMGVNNGYLTRTLRSLKARAAKQGYAPDHDLEQPVPDGFKLKGTSTLYDEAGKKRLQWYKTTEDRERMAELLQESVEAMAESLPRVSPKPPPAETHDQLMSVIPLGDPHFGLYAWWEEAGEDFDLDIARNDLCAAVDYLVGQSPASKRCAIVNLGDFFHAQNFEGLTKKNKHALDVDTRLPKVERVGVAAMRQAIESALQRHEQVDVVNALGNHDEDLSPLMSILLANVYENEPRVVVHDQPTWRHYLQWGKVLIGVTHGDKTKDRDLPGIMATERPQQWGETRHRYFLRGHEHHDERVEHNGCIVEQVRSLKARDAHEVGAGYLSGRDIKLMVMHAEYGEVGRTTCSIDMLRDQAA